MNADTFKGMCMLAGTERGKQKRKYYIAMENALLRCIKKRPSGIGLPSILYISNLTMSTISIDANKS
jgi:hypothetical protein